MAVALAVGCAIAAYRRKKVPSAMSWRPLVLWCFVLHSHRLFFAPHMATMSIERYEIICV